MAVSACSNVTSQHTDLKKINAIIKNFKANYLKDAGKKFLFVCDAVAYVPHNTFDISPEGFDEIDYVSLSPHKMLGGSESTGILIVKRSVYNSENTPSFPGGGTVLMVIGVDEH